MDEHTRRVALLACLVGGAAVGHLIGKVADVAWRQGHRRGYRSGTMVGEVEGARMSAEAAARRAEEVAGGSGAA